MFTKFIDYIYMQFEFIEPETIIKIIASLTISIVILINKYETIKTFILSIINSNIFSNYNKSLHNISIKKTTYSFLNFTLNKNSQELFKTMKIIYDKESLINVPDKRISFKFYELSDDLMIYNSTIRFMNYFKERNGLYINIFISNPTTKEELRAYINKNEIRKIKII